MTVYHVVRHGSVALGIGLVGSHPDAIWLLGWLKDHLVRDPRLKRSATEAAAILAGLVREQWPGRPFFLEIGRVDGHGLVRVEHQSEPAVPNPATRN